MHFLSLVFWERRYIVKTTYLLIVDKMDSTIMRKVQIAMAGTRGNNSQAERSQRSKTSSSRSFQNSNHHNEHQPKAPTKRNHLQEPFMGTQKHNLIICPEGKMIKTNANCIFSICYYLYSTQKKQGRSLLFNICYQNWQLHLLLSFLPLFDTRYL